MSNTFILLHVVLIVINNEWNHSKNCKKEKNIEDFHQLGKILSFLKMSACWIKVQMDVVSFCRGMLQ